MGREATGSFSRPGKQPRAFAVRGPGAAAMRAPLGVDPDAVHLYSDSNPTPLRRWVGLAAQGEQPAFAGARSTSGGGGQARAASSCAAELGRTLVAPSLQAHDAASGRRPGEFAPAVGYTPRGGWPALRRTSRAHSDAPSTPGRAHRGRATSEARQAQKSGPGREAEGRFVLGAVSPRLLAQHQEPYLRSTINTVRFRRSLFSRATTRMRFLPFLSGSVALNERVGPKFLSRLDWKYAFFSFTKM